MKSVVIIAIAFVLLVPSTIFAQEIKFAEKYDWEKEYGPFTSTIYIMGNVELLEKFSGQQLEVYVKKPGDAKRLLDIIQIDETGRYATILTQQGGLPQGEIEIELRSNYQSYIGYITITEDLLDRSKQIPRYIEWNRDCSVLGQTGIINVQEKPFGLPPEDIESYYYQIQDKKSQVISSGTNSGDLLINFEEFPNAFKVVLYSSQNLIKTEYMCEDYIPYQFQPKIQCPSKEYYDLVETRTNDENVYSYTPKENAMVSISVSHSPFQEIPNNYKVLADYTDGSAEVFTPEEFGLLIPLKNYDGQLSKVTFSGDKYLSLEKEIDCKVASLGQPILKKQYESQQEFDRASQEAINYCNYMMSGCKVSYNVDHRVNAPNEFFLKKWTEENPIHNVKKIDYSFGSKNNNDYFYRITSYTHDNQKFAESGRQTYDMGAVFIMEDGQYWEDNVPYFSEVKIMNFAGHSREVVHYWIEEELDTFVGIGNLRYDYHYDYETGLLLKMEFDRELLDVGGVTNTDGYVMEVSSVNFPKSSSGIGGGCLIATATYGSELAPQIQKLREIRDSKLLATESGTNFMESFNQFYYSFSPVIADYERENPAFKEMVKWGVTPLITTLSLMDYADSESEVLGIGIGVILLNLGMYVGIPVFTIMRIRK